jgi:hypothetical protein
MSRRYVVPLVIFVLVAASLAAVAAVGSISTPTLQVTPQIHREGTEGYFRLAVPLPDPSPPLPLAVMAKVVDGDAWLVTAQAPLPANMKHGEDDEEAPSAAKREMIVSGRFGKPGPVRMTILGRTTNGPFKPIMNLSFRIPGGEMADPGVRTAWARMQQAALASADPLGEDSYSHYWDLAIAPRYGLTPRLHESTGRLRREPPDLYSVFTGAAAIQESLQLELLGSGPQTPAQREAIKKGGNPAAEPVPLASLTGPTVKSHPFREMLKGRTPQVPQLATYIPEDQYAVFFSDINRQIELADLMDEWGGNLLHQVEASARDFQVRQKVSRQLCLENSWLTRMFGDRVIADMAFTGSDPFLKEGTAFTVLFTLKDAGRFRKQMERQYSEAVKSHGAKRSAFTIDGVSGFSVVSPDRGISSHTLIMGNTAVVSTSLQSLQRIADCAARRAPSLAEADDFRYMRTIFPQNAAEEDIFIYLSDAHIRNLVGARWKIGEARRMRCSGNMALLANARLWYKAEQRREPTMAELVSGGYLGTTQPICPDHGRYEFDRDGQPYCSLHNRQGRLTPVGEVELSQVTTQEAAQYKAFVENYNRYWTRFFDPIGIRVRMGKDIRIQTCILPLIENSWYDGLAAFSGRKAGELTESAVLPRTIMSLRGHVDQQWLDETRLPHRLGTRNLKLDWLGDEIALNLCDGQVLFSAGGRAMGLMGQEMGRSSLEPLIFGYLGSAINLPTYLTVKVTDSVKAEQAIPGLFQALTPGNDPDGEFSVETYSIEDHNGKPLYVAGFNLWILKLRLYSAVVDDRLVIASRRDIVTDLMDAASKGAGAKVARQEGNMELSLYRSAFKQLEETVNLGWQEDLRHACHQNLPLAAILIKTLGLPPDSLGPTVAGLRGYQPYCPSGGRYLVDERTGAVTCTIHGTAWNPKQPPAGDKSSKTLELVNSLERVNARLAFTPEGLMTTVDIRRGGK